MAKTKNNSLGWWHTWLLTQGNSWRLKEPQKPWRSCVDTQCFPQGLLQEVCKHKTELMVWVSVCIFGFQNSDPHLYLWWPVRLRQLKDRVLVYSRPTSLNSCPFFLGGCVPRVAVQCYTLHHASVQQFSLTIWNTIYFNLISRHHRTFLILLSSNQHNYYLENAVTNIMWLSNSVMNF